MDIDAVKAFIFVSQLESFTLAADALGSSQSGISVKIKRLETQLDRRLLARTPRHVRLSTDGRRFLPYAKKLLNAHENALRAFQETPQRVSVGITHHIVGHELPPLLTQLFMSKSQLSLELYIASSWEVMEAYRRNKLDVAIALRHSQAMAGGQLLFEEPFSWYASPSYFDTNEDTVRLAAQMAPCSVRALATDALTRAHIGWKEVFTGGGVAAVSAAVASGVAIAAMSRHAAPKNAIDVTNELNLPALGTFDVTMHTTLAKNTESEITQYFVAALQSSRSH